MSLSNGNGSSGGPGEPIPRYLNPPALGGTSVLPDRRRRGKNLGGNYYGSSGPRSDGGGRYQGGGSGYQRNHRGGGGGGDGPHNGTSGYHMHRSVGDYDPQQQQHSPTDSHGSGRSSGHHHQGSMNHSSVNHHYQHGHQSHHQYHKQDYDGLPRHDYRSQRGSAGGGGAAAGDQHHHNQHHHHHHGNHYNNHHHRISVQTQQQQLHSDAPTSSPSGHPSQSSHSASGFGGNVSTPSNGHQSMNAPVAAAETAIIAQPPQPPPEHVYPPPQTTNGNGGGHFQQQSGQHVSPATMIQQFPAGMPAAPGPATATVGFYGYHPNSQPMFGSLALCHIPYGVNPSSVISPIVYTQIIGSGMLTPGLPYNLTCGIPTQFLQPSTAPPMILQPPQQHLQPYPHQPHYHHHYHPHPNQFVGNHSLQAGNSTHHQTTSNQTQHQHNQGGGLASGTAGDACVLFDSSSLLNPDADAFFPPAFPPSEGDVAEMSADLGDGEDGIVEEPIVVDGDDDVKTEMERKPTGDVSIEENVSQNLISNAQEDEDCDDADERENGDGDENETSKCNTSGASKISGAGDGNEVGDDMSWA